MGARFPLGPARLKFGLTLDLPWDQDPGVVADPDRGDVVSDSIAACLGDISSEFSHLSVGWQPRRRPHVEAKHYFAAYDDLFARAGGRFSGCALHHTTLSRRGVEAYRRGELLEVTNALVDRYGFSWVSEDVGLWPIQGKPPNSETLRFDKEGLWAAIRHACVVRAGLEVPLLVDFPAFAGGGGFGAIHAYDFFRAIAEEADVGATLDVAKLLAYQWALDKRGEDLLGELDKLPLDRCIEIRVSSRDAKSGRSFGGPADVLFDAQLEMIERLMPVCPNVRVIACEAPLSKARDAVVGFGRLRELAAD